MITLEEYKKYLLNTYRYAIDGTPEKYQEREKFLKNWYSDGMLNKIIEDTYSFARDIINNMDKEYRFWELDIDEDKSFEINLLISGGYDSDYIYEDNDGRFISRYILETIFGKSFMISVNCDLIERENDDPDILSYYHRFFLSIQGIPKDLDDIKKELFKDEKILKK